MQCKCVLTFIYAMYMYVVHSAWSVSGEVTGVINFSLPGWDSSLVFVSLTPIFRYSTRMFIITVPAQFTTAYEFSWLVGERHCESGILIIRMIVSIKGICFVNSPLHYIFRTIPSWCSGRKSNRGGPFITTPDANHKSATGRHVWCANEWEWYGCRIPNRK